MMTAIVMAISAMYQDVMNIMEMHNDNPNSDSDQW